MFNGERTTGKGQQTTDNRQRTTDLNNRQNLLFKLRLKSKVLSKVRVKTKLKLKHKVKNKNQSTSFVQKSRSWKVQRSSTRLSFLQNASQRLSNQLHHQAMTAKALAKTRRKSANVLALKAA